jgi:hypothetical protein
MSLEEKAFIQYMRDVKAELVPYATNIEKIRIGVPGDGGYVIANLPESSGLFSYGCDDNIRFERAYHARYGAPCWVYDHTIKGITDKPDFITFFKQGVGPETTAQLDTIDNQVGARDCRTLWAQIDIEGYEWVTLKDSVRLKEFAQVIVEFHMAVNIPRNVILATLRHMNEHFVLVHIHGNNCPLQPWLDISLPRVFECTYVRRDLVTECRVDTGPFPIPNLDYPNSPDFPDLALTWWQASRSTVPAGPVSEPI